MAHKINEHVSLPDVKEALLHDIQSKQRALNTCIDELNKTEIQINNIEELLEKTKEGWLSNYIDTEKQKFFSSAFVPILTKRQIESDYQRVYDTCEPILTRIRGIFNECPVSGLKQDSKGKYWFDSKEAETYAEEHSKAILPPVIREYYTVLGTLYDSYKAVKDWEKANNFRGLADGYTVFPSAVMMQNGLAPLKQSISELFKDGYLSMERFAQMYTKGIIYQKSVNFEDMEDEDTKD